MVIKVTRIEQVRFPKSKDVEREKKLVKRLAFHRWKSSKILTEYADALGVGGKALEMAARNASHSFSVKFTSSVIQNKRLAFGRRVSLVELEEISHDLKLEGFNAEPVPLHVRMKPNGDFRPICDFRNSHRTAQTVGRRMLERHVNPLPWQYDFKGTGAAIEVVRDAILSGKTAIALVDIKNFYGSFDEKTLREELPVPVKMVDNYLVGRKLKYVTMGNSCIPIDVLLSKARSGISHGSSASPIIGAHTVSKLIWHPAPGIIPAAYVDDFGLVAGSYEGVVADAKAVCAAIAALPTGNFVGILKWSGDASEGFDYLGVHMRLGKKLEIHPGMGRLEEFKLELTKRIYKASIPTAAAAKSQKDIDRPVALQAIAEVWQYSEGWLAAFRTCDDIDAYRQTALGPILALLTELKCDLNSLKLYTSEASKGGYPK
jgi:hypothetical protein